MYGKFGKFHVQSTVILYFSSNTFDCAYYNAHLEIRDGTTFVVIGLRIVNLHLRMRLINVASSRPKTGHA